MDRGANRALSWGVLIFAVCLPVIGHADSLRCNGRLVDDGDPAVSVLRACGEPSFRDPWWGDRPAAGVAPMMEWTYNHGPRRLMEQVVFRNGRVIAIRSAGYGFDSRPLPQSGSCEPTFIEPGMSKYELLEACGKPIQRTAGYSYSAAIDANGQRYFFRHGGERVYRERWIYNFGGNRLLRQVTLDNARVVSVQTLDRGFDRR